MKLYAHPFAAYCWKPLIALGENGTPFEFVMTFDEAEWDRLLRLWPMHKFPVLEEDDGRVIPEATAIVEDLAVHHPGPVPLIPADPEAAVEARLMDRIFDNHVAHHFQTIVWNTFRPDADRNPSDITASRAALDKVYVWLDQRLAGRSWAAGEAFTLADCAAAPALFYADWTQPIPETLATLKAFRQRLLARPSVAQVVDNARPYRHFFPLGAPDRD